MCGISGGRLLEPIDRRIIEDGLDTMRHRGPDDRGVFQDNHAFIGNRRLSIIDLEGGHQPICNEDGSIHVVLNGEIYNYVELIEGLVARGHVFQTRSDTEVLVHLYEQSGPAMVDRLRGMFAFAIWDSRQRVLFLARDRFGKKPLYYTVGKRGLLFASELKALHHMCADLGDSWEIRDQGIYDYLSLGIIPQPETIFRDVWAVPPGSWMIYDGKEARTRRYWHLEYLPKTRKPRAAILSEVRAAISEAVRLRLRSDVPLGVFLSGGIDSSIIAYEASRVVGGSLRTFTVEMPGSDLDESPVARRTSRFLGVENSVVTLDISPLRDLTAVIRWYDQPIADPSTIPSLRVSQLAREHVKVILNGDGGDEIFAGYRRYLAYRYSSLLSWLPSGAIEGLGKQCRRWSAGRRSALGFAARVLNGLNLDPAARYLAWTTDSLREEDKQGIWLGNHQRPTEHLLATHIPENYSQLDTAMSVDIGIILLSDLLVKMDIATMAASVEGRSPLLDHEIAELVAVLPDSLKIRFGISKAVLREAYKDLLPKEVIRGSKKGFEPPLLQWLQGDLRPLLMDTLGSPSARVKDFVSAPFVSDILEGRIMRDRNWSVVVYTLLILELWLRDNASGQPKT